MVRRAARHGLLAAAVVAALLAACSGSGSGSDGGSASVADGPCAWAIEANRDLLNIAYPDTAATYWGMNYDLADGQALELAGTFPTARYASFITYGPMGGALDVLTDRDLQPDPGSTNPFAGGADGRYTVTLDGGPGTDTTNHLAADPADATVPVVTTPSTTEVAAAARDPQGRLGDGGGDGLFGTVLYRVYLPTDRSDPTGGAPLPAVTVVDADGTRHAVDTCADPGPSPNAVDLVEANGPTTDKPAPDEPLFLRPAGEQTNLFPDPDNIYLATIVAHRPGRVVVLYGRSPAFPDTRAGDAVSPDDQVRYWSMCSDEYRKPYPVTACLADDEVTRPDGTFEAVLSTPDDRPSNVGGDGQVPWLDWGTTDVDNLVLIRHMLPNPDAPGAASSVEPGGLAQTAMGDFTPHGVYCATSIYEQGGLDACLSRTADG